VIAGEGLNVAGNEPVTSPDQLKPGHRKAGRIGAMVTIVALLVMIIGNHQGQTEDIWLIGIAAGLATMLILDSVLRRNGLRS
jgi:hypothetical protein